jgi:hypothetical protein
MTARVSPRKPCMRRALVFVGTIRAWETVGPWRRRAAAACPSGAVVLLAARHERALAMGVASG